MFLFLLFACALLSSLLVYPLFFFATNFHTGYSVTVSFLLIALSVFLFLRQIRKHGVRSAAVFITKFLIVAAGLSSFFVFVIRGTRIFAFLSIFAAAVFYIIAARKLKPKITELSSEKL